MKALHGMILICHHVLLSRIVKSPATPWTSMPFHIFLPWPPLILLAGIPFWKLGPLLFLSHDLVQISPAKVSPYLRPSKAKVFISSESTLDLVQTLFRVFRILITYLCTHWLTKDESGTVTNAGNNTEKDAGWPPLLQSSHPWVITGWLPASPHPSQGRAEALLVSAFFFFISTKHRTGIQ